MKMHCLYPDDGERGFNIKCRMLLLSVLIVLFAASSLHFAYAQTTRYVDGTGTNSGNCNNPENPCATIGYAIIQSAAGDSIVIGPGAYTEILTINKSITLRGSGQHIPGGTVIQAHTLQNQADSRVITLNEGFIVSISDVMIRHGRETVGSHPWGMGGGIRNYSSSLTLKNVTFSNNRADFGGGLSVGGGSIVLENVIFNGNTADRSGGGMYNEYVNTSLTDIVFEGNSAELGGGLYNTSFNLSNSPVLTNVSFHDNTADYGGGMYNTGAATLHNVVFSENKATVQGGGMGTHSTAPSLTDVSFISNEAGVRGGGMYIWLNSPTLTNVSFSNNTAGELGGGISNQSNSSPVITHSAFTGNTAGYAGGGVHNESNSSPVFTAVNFIDNSSYYGGGMFSMSNCSPTLSEVMFSGNYADQIGGGMYNLSNMPLLVAVVFDNNSAQWAGGMYNTQSNAQLYNSVFINNKASNSGGGLGNNGGSPSLINVVFSENEALTNFGGAVWNLSGSSPVLRNLTISDNHAGKRGGGIINFEGSSPVVYNSIVWGNTAGEEGNEIYNATDGAPGSIQLHYSLYGNNDGDIHEGDGFECSNCITDDPLFLDMTGGDFRLDEWSPAVDAGDPATNTSIYPLNYDEIPIDIDGNPRFHNGRIDIGAYEYQGALTSVGEISEIPSTMLLYQNYPNPFNPMTTIRYAITERSHVELTIYDVLGRKIAVLVDTEQIAGGYDVRFDAAGLPSGVYLYQLRTDNFVDTKKLILAR